jgi:outer membrane protein assembly factor BamB
VVLAMLSFAGSAFGGLIYTTAYSGSANDSLATITTSGVGSVIGKFGYSDVLGLAFAPNGTLYAEANGHMATVDLGSGAATPYGVTTPVQTLAFAADGTLYGARVMGNQLYTVNVASGAAAALPQLLGFSNIMDLAFSPAGVLYAIACDNNNSYIYQLNTTTGAATGGPVSTLNIGNLMGLTFDAAGDVYLTSFTTPSTLYQLNPSLTILGQVNFNSHGLDMDNFAPEPATWMLMGSSLLAFGGIRRMVSASRRRQP